MDLLITTPPIYVYDLAGILFNLIKLDCAGVINIASNKAVSKYDCLIHMKEIMGSTSTIKKVSTKCGTARSLHNGLSTRKVESIYESFEKNGSQ